MIPAQVRLFQADPANVGPFGKPLRADGVRGPQTLWAEAFATASVARHVIAARAWQHAGLVETAPNEDPEGLIRAWLKAAGAKPGEPWCASWASWCLQRERPMSGALRLAAQYPTVAPELALAFDLVSFATNAKGNGHVEFLLGLDLQENLALTLGGNVANGVRFSLRPLDRVKISQTVKPIHNGAGRAERCPGIIRHADAPLRAVSFEGTR